MFLPPEFVFGLQERQSSISWRNIPFANPLLFIKNSQAQNLIYSLGVLMYFLLFH